MALIKDIFAFFENFDEYVYAVDIEFHDIVYMNKKAQEAFNVRSLEEIKGKKCYEVLEKISLPCGMCNNAKLSVGEFTEREHYNPILDKYLMIKDTLVEDSQNGRKYRVEMAADITQQREQSTLLQKQRGMETMVNEMLRVALNTANPEQSIYVILEQLGHSLNAQRVYIFEKNAAGGDDNTYEWTAEGISSEKDSLQDLPPEACATWYSCFAESKNIIFSNIEQAREENPLQYEILKRQNIQSLVVVPLYNDGVLIGFYGVDNPPFDTLGYVSYMLEVMSHFLVSCIKRRNLVRRLRNMSCMDPLTKLGNRFAMNEYVEAIHADQSIGVIYCDITGLKAVNDTQGHEAGDSLIVRASECLKKAFEGYGVFRIGGDEFLVLCAGIEEEAQKKDIEALRSCMKQKNVNMAVGEIWLEKAATDLDVLLQKSESLMYEEKAAYYKAAGRDRRKV